MSIKKSSGDMSLNSSLREFMNQDNSMILTNKIPKENKSLILDSPIGKIQEVKLAEIPTAQVHYCENKSKTMLAFTTEFNFPKDHPRKFWCYVT